MVSLVQKLLCILHIQGKFIFLLAAFFVSFNIEAEESIEQLWKKIAYLQSQIEDTDAAINNNDGNIGIVAGIKKAILAELSKQPAEIHRKIQYTKHAEVFFSIIPHKKQEEIRIDFEKELAIKIALAKENKYNEIIENKPILKPNIKTSVKLGMES